MARKTIEIHYLILLFDFADMETNLEKSNDLSKVPRSP